MAKLLARLVVTLAVLYGIGATVFAFAHYAGEKPGVPTILADFHGWMSSFWKRQVNPKPAPPTEQPAPAPEPAPPTEPTPPHDPKEPPAGLSDEDAELWRIEHNVLPEATRQARLLRSMSRADSQAFEEARVSVLSSLYDARALLNAILERETAHRQANRLWNTLQELYTAVKKL